MATDGLLRLENEVLEAMISVRYALDFGERPRQRHLDIIRRNSSQFADLAEKLQLEQEDEE